MDDNQLMPTNRVTTTQRTVYITPEQAAAVQADFFAKVYAWMAAALGLTGGVALFASTSPTLLHFVFGTRFVFYGFIIAELVLVGFLSSRMMEWSRGKVQAAFVSYAILHGITLSCIFLIYTSASIASTFFVAGGAFGVMSLFGYFTKADLSGWGKLLSMALVGLGLSLLVSLFWHNSLLETGISFIGVLLFVALTAYDTQQLKQMALLGLTEGEEVSEKVAIMGALKLYLDFVNMFLFLLRLFGRRR